MLRRFVVVGICLVAAGTAHAQMCPTFPGQAQATTGMLPNSEVLQFCKLFLHENNSPDQNPPIVVPDSLWHYFNWSHCECSRPNAAQPPFTPYHEDTFAYQLLLTPVTAPPIHRPLEIWVGSNCTDNVLRPMQCHQITSAGVSDMSLIQTMNGIAPEVPIFDLMNPEPSTTTVGCPSQILSATEWAISDSMGTGTFDFFQSVTIPTDSQPPPLPTCFAVEGADNAINIDWSCGPPQGNVADVFAYQVLCAKLDGTPALSSPAATPQYQTPRQLCGFQEDLQVPMTGCTGCVNGLIPFTPGQGAGPTVDAGVVDAFVAAAPPPDAPIQVTLDNVPCNGNQCFNQVDPAFICGQQVDPTATAIRVTGLQNGVSYAVIFLAMDKFGNPAGYFFTQAFTPQPVTDFWQDLHDRGSQVEGGLCLIAETYGDDNPLTKALRTFRDDTLAHSAFGRWLTSIYYATLAKAGALVHGHVVLRMIAGVLLLPLVAIALLWHVVTLPGLLALVVLGVLIRKRRLAIRARHAAPVAALLVFVLAPKLARADRPYWQEDTAPPANITPTDVPKTQPSFADEPEKVKWHVGIRVGPYTPQIDAQLGGMSPGPYQQMYGGAAVMPMLDVDRVLWRRFGQVAVGVNIGYMQKSAHAWVIGSSPTDPNRPRSPGDTNSFHLIPMALTAAYRFTYLDDEWGVPIVPYARAGAAYYLWWMIDPNGNFSQVCSMSGCGNKAYGASIGLQGSLGIAVRAERVDASAAQSMRDSGIYHAGFYAEVSTAQVGFGSAKKLAVGDTTWFAGIDFEF
jgi:hypothetical protein